MERSLRHQLSTAAIWWRLTRESGVTSDHLSVHVWSSCGRTNLHQLDGHCTGLTDDLGQIKDKQLLPVSTTESCVYVELTLQKLPFVCQKIVQNLTFKKKKIAKKWQFLASFWKNVKFWAIFFTFKWQFSGVSDRPERSDIRPFRASLTHLGPKSINCSVLRSQQTN